MYRIALLAMLLALSACRSGALTTSQTLLPQAAARHATTVDVRGPHLYVAVSTATHHPSVERFKLVNGIPEPTPDRVYDGYGGLIAVSSNGTLYAFGALSSGGSIFAFGPRSNKPVREIEVPNPRHCGTSSGGETGISALAADAQGHLFAGIYTYDGGAPARTRPVFSQQTNKHVPCNGVAIFAPDANGKAEPVQAIPLGGGIVAGLAVDARDNAYVTSYPFEVIEYANAVKEPQRTRVFSTKLPARFTSLAIDGAGDIFISNTEYGYQTGWIDRYAPSAKSKGPPTSQILLAGSKLHMLFSIAVQRRNLYAADSFVSVDLYHARKNGAQSPAYSLDATNVSSVAVGP